MNSTLHHDLTNEAAKGLPPATVAVTQMTGAVDWQTWVLMLTVAYLLLQIVYLVWKFIDRAQGRNKD